MKYSIGVLLLLLPLLSLATPFDRVIAVKPGENVTIGWGVNLETQFRIAIVTEDQQDNCMNLWVIRPFRNDHRNRRCGTFNTSVSDVSWELRAGGFKKEALVFISERSDILFSFLAKGDVGGEWNWYSLKFKGNEIRFSDFNRFYSAGKDCGINVTCWKNRADNKPSVSLMNPTFEPES